MPSGSTRPGSCRLEAAAVYGQEVIYERPATFEVNNR